MSQKWIEKVSMKWIDRQNAKKMEMPLKWINFYNICFTGTRMCYYILSISVAFPYFCTFPSIHFRGMSSFNFCGTWSIHPFQRHFLYLHLSLLICVYLHSLFVIKEILVFWIIRSLLIIFKYIKILDEADMYIC